MSVAPQTFKSGPAAMLANTCAGCHGTLGDSMGPATPTIAGLEADYIVEVMEDYKSGERHSTIMTRIAKGYSDKEIEQMAAFFSAQPYNGYAQIAAD
ncbi:MAG: c-type cytochrome, partial [Candidatus Sedimenticola sp. 6PFRAG1]